jgi:hypothetical protein
MTTQEKITTAAQAYEGPNGLTIREYEELAFAAGAQWLQQQYIWISVKEKWPEKYQHVLFVVDHVGHTSHGKVYGGVYIGHGNQEWSANAFTTPGCTMPASHWMPSPEPPKTESK